MSARPPSHARALARAAERDALAEALARHAPRGAVRIAEALAAVAMNRRRRRERVWNGAFADGALADAGPRFAGAFAGLAEQPIGTRADAAWNAICRRIAARALAGAGPDPSSGAICATAADAPSPAEAPRLAARLGDFAFYRGD
jgi:hypothetical protein